MLLRTHLLLAAALSSAALNGPSGSSVEDWADSLVKWETRCSPRGCLLQTDVLRGESGNPPAADDLREYIGIDVALERKDAKPAYIAFHVHPQAQRDQGIFIAFTKTTREGDRWKLNADQNGAMRLDISDCSANSCVARVPMGIMQAGKEGPSLNLIEKLLDSSHLWLLYMKDGKPYRTLVLLSSFRKEYRRVLDHELAPSSGH